MIILASRSPRRRQLLDMLGIEHIVDPAEIDESVRSGETPEDAALRLASEKACLVARRHPGEHVLAADTVVVLDRQILGKPSAPEEAHQMIARLAGRQHLVITAVALVKDAEILRHHDVTRVWFRTLDEELINAYVATGEPLDKAGSYGVQGYGAVLVERIEGDFFSVMGLPLRLVIDLLESAGIRYRFTR